MGVLRGYVVAQGSASPPTHLVVEGFALGRWVARCREKYRAGALSAERVAEVEGLPGWSWGRTQRSGFEEGLAHVRTYVARYGTAEVPLRAVVDGFPVGEWVARRQESQIAGELRPGWAAELESLPGWRWRQERRPFGWDEGLAVLQAWVAEQGEAVVPVGATYQGFALGVWVQAVRRRYTQGTLAPQQVTVVEGLPGWAWGERQARFQQGLDLLEQYRQATGSASPNQFYVHPSGFTLGAWVGRVRTLYRTGALPAERVAALEAVPGWRWNPMADLWQRTLGWVRASALEHGGVQAIPRPTRVQGTQLVVWSDYQRLRARHGRLTPQETTALESLPGWSWYPTPSTSATG